MMGWLESEIMKSCLYVEYPVVILLSSSGKSRKKNREKKKSNSLWKYGALSLETTPLLLTLPCPALKDAISPIHSGLSLLIKDAGGKRSNRVGFSASPPNHSARYWTWTMSSYSVHTLYSKYYALPTLYKVLSHCTIFYNPYTTAYYMILSLLQSRLWRSLLDCFALHFPLPSHQHGLWSRALRLKKNGPEINPEMR